MRTRQVQDGKLSPLVSGADPHFGEFYVDDGTGVVLTTPTAATLIAGAPLTIRAVTGVAPVGVTLNVAAGSLTVARNGNYRIYANLGEVVGVNSAAQQVIANKNGVAIGLGLVGKLTNASTALALVTMSLEGVEYLERGDIITFTAISSTGNFTVRRARFGVRQVDDGLVPTPV